jgi:hypothetical protein
VCSAVGDLGGVGRVFVDTVLRWYARTLRARGVRAGQSGAVTVVQRVSADLRLNSRQRYLA